MNKSEIKYILDLQDKRFRDQEGVFILEGEKAINDAYLNGATIIKLYELEKNNNNIKSTIISEVDMKKIGNLKTIPKKLAIVKKINSKDFTGNVLVLEDIQDPLNMGTILRSALAFGFKNIFISEGSVDIYNPKVLRGASSSIFSLNIKRGNIIEFLNSTNLKIYGTVVSGGKWGVSIDEPFALIIGNEGQGMKEYTIKKCNELLTIPTEGVESLNAAVATSIILYELGGKR